MYIAKIIPGFSDLISIGKYSVFVHIDKNGVNEDLDDVYEKIKSFNNIIIKSSDDPLNQKEELGKLLKKIVKSNPNVSIEVYTKGSNKPLDFNHYKDNVKFNMIIDLEEELNINDKKYIFYSEIGSNFIFNIKTIEDIDSIVTITNGIGIKKQQIYIRPKVNIENLEKYVKYYNFNLAFKVVW